MALTAYRTYRPIACFTLFIVGCSESSSFDGATFDKQQAEYRNEKFIQDLQKAKPGDSFYFREIYWHIETTDGYTMVVAGANASTNVAKNYRVGLMRVDDTMRFNLKIKDLHSLRRGAEYWVVSTNIIDYSGF